MTPEASPAVHAAETPATREAVDAPLPTLAQALTDATARLRGCARLAGDALLVEFVTEAAREGFGDVTIRSGATPEVESCVRDATAPLRFRPEGPLLFTREYTP